MQKIKKVGSQIAQTVLHQLTDLKGHRILVIGDIGLDEYVMGSVRRISPEAPVPIVEVEREEAALGLSANVAQNIKSLGGEVCLISVVGQDTAADQVRSLLQEKSISTEHLIVDSNRPTTRKTRVMALQHHLVRVDYETRSYLTKEISRAVISQVEKVLPLCCGVVIQDYAKGVVNRDLVCNIIDLAHAQNKRVFVDPNKSTPIQVYEGVDLIKPNFDEAMALSGLNYDSLRDKPEVVGQIGKAIIEKTKAAQVVMTRGKEGMLIYSGETVTQVPTYARQVFDVTGAGDTVIAALALGLSAGWSLEKSAVLANYAAGVVVGKIGCVPCDLAELQDYIEDHL